VHTSRPTVAIVGAFTARPDLPRSPPSLTAIRWPDLERLLDPAASASDAVVCAAVLLLHRAGHVRAVLARTLDDLPAEVDAIALPGPIVIDTITSFLTPSPPRPPLILDLPDLSAPLGATSPPPSLDVRYVRARGSVTLPGRLRALPVSGTTLALPLLLGTPTLLPLCDLIVPLAPPEDRAPGLVDLVLLRRPRSGPRVALASGTLPLLPRHAPGDDLPDTVGASDDTEARAAEAPSQPTREPTASGWVREPVDPRPSDSAIARLEASLGALTDRFAHRLERGPAPLATLRREASRLLQAERARGAIGSFALSVELAQDHDGADAFIIEAAVTLPRRVGKVILRVVQR